MTIRKFNKTQANEESESKKDEMGTKKEVI